MVEAADLVASLRGEDIGFGAMMLLASRRVSDLGHQTTGTLGGVGKLTTGLGVLAGVGLAASVKAAVDFQTELQHVYGNTTLTAAQIKVLGDQVLAMSSATGAPISELASGLEHIANFGINAADAMKVLKPATESALATGAEVGSTAEALAKVIHEFGLSADQAAAAMNTLHLAAAEGNSRLQEFETGTTRAINTAATYGVTLADVSAALSTLTQSGQSARVAGDGVTSMMNSIVKPTSAAFQMVVDLSHATGVDLVSDFSAAGLHARNLSGVLQDTGRAVYELSNNVGEQQAILAEYAARLKAHHVPAATFAVDMQKMAVAVKDPTQALVQLFPNVRSSREALLLLTTQSQAYTQHLNDMADAMSGKVDPTQKAFAAQQATMAGQMRILTANLQVLAIDIGTVLIPPLTKLTSAIVPVVQGIVDWAQHNPALTATFVDLGAAFAAIATGIRVVSAVAGPLRFVLTALDPPVAALGVAAFALYQAWTHDWGGIREVTQTVWTALKPVLTDLKALVDVLTAGFAKGDLSGAWKKFTGDLPALGKDLSTFVSTVGTQLGKLGGEMAGWTGAHIKVGLDLAGNLKDMIVPWLAKNAPKGADWLAVHLGMALDLLGGLKDRVVSWLAKEAPKGAEWLGIHLHAALDLAGNLKDSVSAWLAKNGASALTSAIHVAIPLSLLFQADVRARLGEWLARNVPAALKAISVAVPVALSFVGNLKDSVGTWLARNAPAGADWLAVHLHMVLDLAGNLKDQVAKVLGPLTGNLTATISAAGGSIGKAVSTWAVQFSNWIGPAWTQFERNWPYFESRLTSLLAGVAGGIGKTLGTWAQRFSDWIGPAATTFLANWPTLLGHVLDAIHDAAKPILSKLGEWGLAFAAWVIPALPGLVGNAGVLAVKLLGGVLAFVASAQTTIGKKLLEWGVAFTEWVIPAAVQLSGQAGLLTLKILGGIILFIGESQAVIGKKLLSWAGEFAGWVLTTAWPALFRDLNKAGENLGDWILAQVGHLNDAFDHWANAMAAWAATGAIRLSRLLAPIPSQIPGWLGDMSQVLVHAGEQVIDGLIQGIKNKFGDLKNIFGQVTSLIPNLKGPPTKDAMLLMPSGQLIMQGLITGIQRQLPALRTQLSGVTETIRQTGGAGTVRFGAAPANTTPGPILAAPAVPITVQMVVDGRVIGTVAAKALRAGDRLRVNLGGAI